jgi:hypothetical protein
MGPNVHTVEESGRCQHLSSLGTDFHAVHAVMGESFLRGREYSTGHGRSRTSRSGVYLRIWRTLRQLQAAL